MISDYYLVRKGYLDVKELYSARKRGPYYGVFGWSWHAYTAYLSGIMINIVGFVGAVGQKVPAGARYIYNVNFFSGFIVSALVYWTLARLVPRPATSDKWNEVDVDLKHFSVAYGVEVSDAEDPEIEAGQKVVQKTTSQLDSSCVF